MLDTTAPLTQQPLATSTGATRTARILARHCAYHLAQVRQDPADWRRIEGIYGQIKRAWQQVAEEETILDFVQALEVYQERRGLWDDRVAWLQRALQLAVTTGRQAVQGVLLNQLGVVYRLQGHWQAALALHVEALTLCRLTGNLQGVGDALERQGLVYDLQGQWREAIACLNIRAS